MTPKEIGLRIVAAREELGITRKELADKVQVAASTITRYEQGSISKIKIPVIGSIARALNVNPLWLIGESDHRSVEAMQIRTLDLSPEEEAMVKKYRLLSPSGRATVDAVIEVQYRSIFPQGPPDTS